MSVHSPLVPAKVGTQFFQSLDSRFRGNERNSSAGFAMRKGAKGIGLAIIGAGRVGLFRGEVAARHPAVEWIGIAELNHNRGGDVAARTGGDFVTTSHRDLLARPDVTAR